METRLRSVFQPESREKTHERPRIEAVHVAKAYATRSLLPLTRRNRVLVDASLTVPAGEIVALVGGNGSGKSTLMEIIAGVLDQDAGEVVLNGTLGYCPQTPVL